MNDVKSTIAKERVPFTQIPNGIINDKNLSALAFKIYCYMMSKPENWTFYNKNIIENMKEGRDACLKAIKELEQSGWIAGKVIRDKRGTFKEYILYIKQEYPGTENQEYPDTENQDTEKYLVNNTNNNTNNICGDESPRGRTVKKEKIKNEEDKSEEYAVYESYNIFYYKITGKHSKLKFLTDTQRACKKIVKEYKILKPDMSLSEFAYKVFGGNYLRLESMDSDHKLRISTASNYVGKNIEYIDENNVRYDYNNAKRLFIDSLSGY